MKYLAIAVLLFASVPALADEVPVVSTAPSPVAAEPPKTVPAPPAAPTHWTLDIDQGDINTLNQCVGKLLYEVAQPFVLKVQSHLKPVQ